MSAPIQTVEFAYRARLWALYGTTGFAAGVILLLLVYPPFLPYLRLQIGTIKRRLGSDHKPLFDGLYRLQHLETHADHLAVGRAARNLGELPMAGMHLLRAFEMDNSHRSGRYDLGRVLCELGRFDDAVRVMESVVQEDEQFGYGDALHHLGLAQARTGATEKAIQTLRRQQEVFPGNRRVHLLLAQLLARHGDKEGCIAELRLAAKPPESGQRLTHEDALARAQARVALWRGGKFS